MTVSGATSGNSRPITGNTIFKFDVVNVNIRGSYDPSIGTNYLVLSYEMGFNFITSIFQDFVLITAFLHSAYKPEADLHGKILDAAALGPIFFIFMQFSSNFGQIINRLAPRLALPLRNPGSAAATDAFLMFIYRSIVVFINIMFMFRYLYDQHCRCW